MGNTGNLAILDFSGWASATPSTVTEISLAQDTIELFKTSTLSTTGSHTYAAVDLYDLGEITATMIFDGEPDNNHALGLTGTLKISWPILSGDAAGPYITGSAILTGFEAGPLTNDDQPTVTVTFQYDGVTGPTWTDGA